MANPQVFHPYTEWEDWQAGMWQHPSNVTAETEQAAHILSDPAVFLDAARCMLRDWPNAAEQNLTTMVQNQRAWIGQATCCHLAGIAEHATRLAWWTLTAAEQHAANMVADQAAREWRTERESSRTPGLFPLELLVTPLHGERTHANA
jgi:hypothetical protein